MDSNGKKLILVSGSPRRRELMEEMELEFEVCTKTGFVETVPEGMDAGKVPSYLAEGKSRGFYRPLQNDEILISADTVVIVGDTILGKPHTEEKAIEMLHQLSGCTHKVISALCLRSNKKCKTVSDTALVTFRQLTEEEISHYVTKFKPMDKAGGYGIQEWIGMIGIERIEGSFYTIMGLPTHLLSELLKTFIS